jgi:hypothetical protein
MSRAALTALLIAAILAACGRLNLPRSDSSGAPYFSTKLCGVDLDGKTKDVHLRIELAVAKTLPRGGLVEVEFENPADRSAPIVVSRTVTGNEKTLMFVSPAVTRVRPRNYEIVSRVYASPDKKQVLGLHTQVCESLIDQRELGPEFR